MSEKLQYHPDFELPKPQEEPIVEPCMKIMTKDSEGDVNGFVVEVAKNEREIQPNNIEENKSTETTVYMTTVAPDAFKGYHGHKLRTSTYSLVAGEAEVHIFNPVEGVLSIYEMNADEQPYRIVAGPGYYLALVSRNQKTAFFIGVPNPPYNSKVNEQVELDPKQVVDKISKDEIKVQRFSCTKDGLVPIQ